MNVAFRTAENSECRMKHAAVVVKNGNILSIGINKNINHPDILSESHVKQNASRHAEMVALRRVANPEGATIFVARVMRDGSEGMSKPCKNCQRELDKAGVKRVVYTTG